MLYAEWYVPWPAGSINVKRLQIHSHHLKADKYVSGIQPSSVILNLSDETLPKSMKIVSKTHHKLGETKSTNEEVHAAAAAKTYVLAFYGQSRAQSLNQPALTSSD